MSTLHAFGHGRMAMAMMRGAVPVVVQSMTGLRQVLRRTGVRRRGSQAQDYRQYQR